MSAYSGQMPGRASCPTCRQGADGFTGTGEVKPPDDGDVAVCAYCCSVNEYRGGGLVPFDIATLAPEERAEVEAMLRVVAAVRRGSMRS